MRRVKTQTNGLAKPDLKWIPQPQMRSPNCSLHGAMAIKLHAIG
jgi:hypothetical protein